MEVEAEEMKGLHVMTELQHFLIISSGHHQRLSAPCLMHVADWGLQRGHCHAQPKQRNFIFTYCCGLLKLAFLVKYSSDRLAVFFLLII